MTEQEWLTSQDPAAMLKWLLGDPRCVLLPEVQTVLDRKLRLFACACCRVDWSDLTDERSRRAIQIAERLADGEATEQERSDASVGSIGGWHSNLPKHRGHGHNHIAARATDCLLPNAVDAAMRAVEWGSNAPQEKPPRATLLRDIFGNPWQPIAKLSGVTSNANDMSAGALECGADFEGWKSPWLIWNDGAIPKLAQVMYDARDFADMPVLGDMLQEAGCEDAAILEHCRGKQRCPECLYKVDGRCLTIYGCKTCGARQWVDIGPHVRGCWVIDLLLEKE